ncbi:UDP-N-acetylmuramoyl-tripeptide--D-alanyl-D-alanine ligase [Neolewinella xylanilytica]|uniref:Alanine racemase n=1 Tax=Neolewinella xylanilytica TaxID=1514080 RepID=A0A2S6I481_9BACT|nr:alanine racemase [Neolewinella xylanilytica]PPK86002.1 UDP-N-acetylmuramoyl-tripeptide--D-alanyl-D-alanine ligase [Neolewinella xylanilytica]
MMKSEAYPYPIGRLYSQYQSYDLVIDSRLVGNPDKALFFALRGERRDGHAFIPQLLRMGVRHFVVNQATYKEYEPGIADVRLPGSLPGPVFTQVDDPSEVLRQLAGYHRRQFDIPVIAITGSNGKTIVKDWLTELMETRYSVCASPRSFNSLIGVPLSVWQLRGKHEVAIFEVGISQPGDMERLRDIVRPTHGVLTTIGSAHEGNFASREALAREKFLLFEGVRQLVINAAEDFRYLAQERVGEGKIVSWSGEGRSALCIDGEEWSIEYPNLPSVYLDNARTATTVARLFAVDWKDIQARVRHLVPLGNRLEHRQGRDGGNVINDSYSNDFSALAAAIDFAETLDTFESITLILGHVQPLENLEQKLRKLLRGRIDRLLLVGDRHAYLLDDFPGAVSYPSVAQLVKDIPGLRFHRETVLVKGASYQGLDQVADMLSQQLHRTILKVDLAALKHNYRTYTKRVPDGCKVIVMAKASAYGSGALPVARVLEDVGADYLAVAYAEEGRELRRGGIRIPIMVLNAEAYSYPMLAEYDLEPVVHRMEQLRYAANLNLPAHIELDTGMGRLGFLASDFRALFSNYDGLDAANIGSLFTHLAASEDPAHDAYTHHQLRVFDQLYEEYRENGGAEVRRHALNSNGISRFPQAAYDMVRLGIGLYGIGDETLQMHLHPALTLTTTVTALSDRDAGQTIGYGRRGKLESSARLAVLSIGYADGLPRLAGEGRFGIRINGVLAPTVGAICMDMCTVDVTAIVDVKVGDEAIIFGPDHPIELLATAAHTIPYEILTNIGQRVHRVYVGE